MNDISKDDRFWAMLCHLAAFLGYFVPVIGNILGPLIVWLAKREQSPYIDQQGKAALNFQITISIAAMIAILLMVVVIGIFLLPIIGIINIVLIVIAAVSAYKGEPFRYPFSLHLIK